MYFYILRPLYVYETAEDTNFKFRVWIDDRAAYPNSWKIKSTMDRTRVT